MEGESLEIEATFRPQVSLLSSDMERLTRHNRHTDRPTTQIWSDLLGPFHFEDEVIIAIAIQRVDGLLGIRLIVIADKCKPLYCTTHIQTMSIEGHDTETRQYSSPHYRIYSNTEGSPEFAAFMHELWAVYQKPRDTFFKNDSPWTAG